MRHWTHAICDVCWTARNPDRKPVRVVVAQLALDVGEPCCWCKGATAGIYVRGNPEETPCGQADEVLA